MKSTLIAHTLQEDFDQARSKCRRHGRADGRCRNCSTGEQLEEVLNSPISITWNPSCIKIPRIPVLMVGGWFFIQYIDALPATMMGLGPNCMYVDILGRSSGLFVFLAGGFSIWWNSSGRSVDRPQPPQPNPNQLNQSRQ